MQQLQSQFLADRFGVSEKVDGIYADEYTFTSWELYSSGAKLHRSEIAEQLPNGFFFSVPTESKYVIDARAEYWTLPGGSHDRLTRGKAAECVMVYRHPQRKVPFVTVDTADNGWVFDAVGTYDEDPHGLV